MICQIDEEYVEDYISVKEMEIESKVVEHLSIMRDYTTDASTRRLLCEYINKFSDKYKICKTCLGDLIPAVANEVHGELDGYWKEEIINGYECSNCGTRYDY